MMRALDCQSFAGGFTLGVAQAGFELAGKRELPGGFGVPSVLANLPLLNVTPDFDVQVGQEGEWDPSDDVPFLFGNPPCSGFSGVSDKNFAGIDSKINDCMWSFADFAARVVPEVAVYESVPNAYARGLPLLRQLHRRLCDATGEAYVLYHVLHNAYLLGGCAIRKRYFWVVSKIPIGFAYPALAHPEPTLWDAIGDLTGLDYSTIEAQPYAHAGSFPWAWDKRSETGVVDGHLAFQPQYHRQSEVLLALPDGWRPGESLTKALTRYYEAHGTLPRMETEKDSQFLAHYGPSGRNFNFGGAWQPERWRAERPARVVTGGSAQRSIHPTEPRPLTLREMYRIQGFPDDWRIKPATELPGGSAQAATLWPGKGIPVQSGRWIAECVRDALEGHPREHEYALERLGDDEFVWNGQTPHKPKPGAVRSRPRTTATTTTKETQVTEQLGTNDPTAIREALLTTGTATVSLVGLDDKQAKKAKELLYAAAYGANRKVRVRTDKATQTATGTLVPEDAPAAAAPVGNVEAVAEAFAEQPAPATWPPRLEPRGAVALVAPAFGPEYDAANPVPGAVWHRAEDQRVFQLKPDLTGWDDVTDAYRVYEAALASQVAPEAPQAPSAGEDAPDDTARVQAALDRAHALQAKNSKREVKDRRFDLTQLRETSHGYYVHRDYAAHYFRWGWAVRQCGPQTRLLEVGCGQDLPLTRVFIYHNGVPAEMVSVDLNKIKDHVQPKWFTLYDETNFIEQQGAIVEKHGRFDVVSCFEVIEHMPKDDGVDLLVALRDSVTDDGFVLLSTPVFNGKAAANHIHEWTVDELAEAINQAGLEVVERYGTFASYHDVKKGLDELLFAADGGVPIEVGAQARELAIDWIKGFYERLREYYADDVLACFMAPNLPDHSRNNTWKLRRRVPLTETVVRDREVNDEVAALIRDGDSGDCPVSPDWDAPYLAPVPDVADVAGEPGPAWTNADLPVPTVNGAYTVTTAAGQVVTYVRDGLHDWHWRCGGCGQDFVRTSQEHVLDWADAHRPGCAPAA